MKTHFIKEHGKLVEKLEIDNETKWIYLKYSKGNFEKSAYTLKTDEEQTKSFIEKFLTECPGTEDLKKEVKKYLQKEKEPPNTNLQDFVNFLITTLSLHIMVGVALGLSIYGGYQLGSKLDSQLSVYPAFTISGVLLGVTLGGLVGYVMMLKYIGHQPIKPKGGNQGKKKFARKPIDPNFKCPSIEVTLEEVREAVRLFAEDLPKGIERTILVQDDYSVNFEKLAPYLNGIPTKKFYMSKETFEIFTENEGEIPQIMDKVQKAIYLFHEEYHKYPIKLYDPLRRVNYYELLGSNYLNEIPTIELYFTDFNGLITSHKPEIKLVGG